MFFALSWHAKLLMRSQRSAVSAAERRSIAGLNVVRRGMLFRARYHPWGLGVHQTLQVDPAPFHRIQHVTDNVHQIIHVLEMLNFPDLVFAVCRFIGIEHFPSTALKLSCAQDKLVLVGVTPGERIGHPQGELWAGRMQAYSSALETETFI